MKFKSNKQFFWRLNVLKNKGLCKVKPKLQPSSEHISEQNRIQFAVEKHQVFWELGKEGFLNGQD